MAKRRLSRKGKDLDINIKVNNIEKAIKAGMEKDCKGKCKGNWKSNCNSCGSAVYGLGFIGALVYYISTANGFWMGVLGFLKALVWPAFLIYELLKFLGV